MSHIIVVGAGQAGSSLVVKLRNLGFDGDVTLIGEEPVPPYQRPPLSKNYLMGKMEKERLYLRPEAFYGEQNIRLQTNCPVSGLNPAEKTIVANGKVIAFDQLALTTGSTPRRLPAAIGGALRGVYVLRSLGDMDAMSPEFQKGRHVLIVGGGYIGLEAAAVAAQKGLRVTLIELADRILQRVAAPETSNYYRSLHHGHGVDIREGVGLTRLTGDGRVTGATLTNGDAIAVDFVMAGVGIMPTVGLAQDAGLLIENGIWTDSQGRTSAPDIWAAGDCTSFPYRGGRIRLESVPNAIDQAEVVAANMLGAKVDYVAKPWFWSDQFDVKLQIAGLNTGYENVVARECGAARSFWYYCGDRLLAVDAMNDPRAYMIGKRLIEAGKTADKTMVADGNADLKALL